MPEGPEIRRAADQLAQVLVNQELTRVFFKFARLKRFQGALSGARVLAVEAHGKALLTRFSNGLTLFSHNQLYGRWYVTPAGATPRTNRSLRAGLYTAEYDALLYSASSIDVVDQAGLAQHPFLKRLGPDILDATLTAAVVAERLADTRFRRRSLGALLLDQGFLAGNGNYLRSEVLFFSGLCHQRRPADLSAAQRLRLARQILAVAARSYRTAGITNPARRVAALKRAGLPRENLRFAVFARAGKPCYVCRTPVKRANVGSRRLYFCPVCQPAEG
jgi:endonuclease-8